MRNIAFQSTRKWVEAVFTNQFKSELKRIYSPHLWTVNRFPRRHPYLGCSNHFLWQLAVFLSANSFRKKEGSLLINGKKIYFMKAITFDSTTSWLLHKP